MKYKFGSNSSYCRLDWCFLAHKSNIIFQNSSWYVIWIANHRCHIDIVVTFWYLHNNNFQNLFNQNYTANYLVANLQPFEAICRYSFSPISFFFTLFWRYILVCVRQIFSVPNTFSTTIRLRWCLSTRFWQILQWRSYTSKSQSNFSMKYKFFRLDRCCLAHKFDIFVSYNLTSSVKIVCWNKNTTFNVKLQIVDFGAFVSKLIKHEL